MFQHKEDKKKLRAKVKFTAFFKNMRPNAMNLETQKRTNGSKSTNHKSLWPFVSSEVHKGVKERKHQFFRFCLTLQKNPKSKDVCDIAGRVLPETGVKERMDQES